MSHWFNQTTFLSGKFEQYRGSYKLWQNIDFNYMTTKQHRVDFPKRGQGKKFKKFKTKSSYDKGCAAY